MSLAKVYPQLDFFTRALLATVFNNLYFIKDFRYREIYLNSNQSLKLTTSLVKV